MRRFLAGTLLFLAFLPAAGAETRPQPSLPARGLEPLLFPDTTGMDPVVQRQIADHRSALESAVKDPAVTRYQLSEAYGFLGKLYHAYELRDAAGACYRNAHKLASGDFRWLYYLAHLYKDQGKLSEAADAFTGSLGIQPDNIPAQLGLAQVLLDQDRVDESERLFAKALTADETSAVAMAGVAKCAMARRDFAGAVAHFESALRIQPGASGLHYPLAMAYRQMGNRQKALDHLAKRGDQMPSGPDPVMDELRDLNRGRQRYFLSGLEALREGNLERAAEEYTRMVAADPNDPVSHLELGAVLLRLGHHQSAKGHFLEVIKATPGNSSALYNLGVLSTQAGASQEAIGYYEAAVRSDPGMKLAHFQLANELVRAGFFEKAALHYRAVTKFDPTSGFARFMLAIVLARLQRYREALDLLEESHRALPADMDISVAMARVLAACPDPSIRNGPRSLEIIERALKGQPSIEIEHLEAFAMTLAANGAFERAIRVQETIIAEAGRAGRQDLVRAFRDTLALYAERKPSPHPWRDDDPIFYPAPQGLVPITPASNAAPPKGGDTFERSR